MWAAAPRFAWAASCGAMYYAAVSAAPRPTFRSIKLARTETVHLGGTGLLAGLLACPGRASLAQERVRGTRADRGAARVGLSGGTCGRGRAGPGAPRRPRVCPTDILSW